MHISGLAELQAQLQGLGRELGRKTLASAARKAFAPVVDSARAKAPKGDSGQLRDALRLQVVMPKGEGAAVVAGLRVAKMPPGGRRRWKVGPEIYWRFVEMGTAKMAARPFARPALDSNASRVVETLKEELAKAIARALRKKAKNSIGGRLKRLFK